MNKSSITLKELKERTKRNRSSSYSKPKTSKEKRDEKISKLSSSDRLWPKLESLFNEDISSLNKSFLKFRSIYQSGKRYSGKEWIKLMADLLDEID